MFSFIFVLHLATKNYPPETNSSHLKIGRAPKGNEKVCAFAVSFRECILLGQYPMFCLPKVDDLFVDRLPLMNSLASVKPPSFSRRKYMQEIPDFEADTEKR